MKMDVKEKKKIYNDSIRVFGEQKQLLIIIEEISELTQAITKHLRGNPGLVQNLKEEIVDVHNMVEQLRFMFFPGNHGTEEFENAVYQKLNRLKLRIQIQENNDVRFAKYKKNLAVSLIPGVKKSIIKI